MERLLIVSPVRDEAAHIQRVVAAVAAQTRPPDTWLAVDDGSRDGTLELLRGAEAELPFLRVLTAPQEPLPAGGDRLALAAEARAFNWALAGCRLAEYDFVGKLDGDILLAPTHFERLLDEFRRDPSLGIAGCYLEQEEGGRLRPMHMPGYHVNGALKLYRRDCFEQIGGVRERLGWDTIDETYARMAGWRTRSFRDLRAEHIRPSGSAGGLLRGATRHGECAWILTYPGWLALARSARLAARRPPLVQGAAFLYGYGGAALRRRRRVEDPAFRAHVRAELRGRLRRALAVGASRRPGASARRRRS